MDRAFQRRHATLSLRRCSDRAQEGDPSLRTAGRDALVKAEEADDPLAACARRVRTLCQYRCS